VAEPSTMSPSGSGCSPASPWARRRPSPTRSRACGGSSASRPRSSATRWSWRRRAGSREWRRRPSRRSWRRIARLVSGSAS